MPPRPKGKPKPKAAAVPVRPALSREFIAGHKRRRIMDAIAELTAEQGYDNLEGKEEVFLAAFDTAVDEAIARIEADCAEVEGDWEEKVQAGLASFLRYVAENPALARMCMIEALSATQTATERYEAAMQRFVDLTKRTVPQDDQLPETIEETLVGGVAWIVYQQIRRQEAEKAEDLLPELSEFMLAPFHGAAEAQKQANA
jgi:AcrR family transcriptional regulator